MPLPSSGEISLDDVRGEFKDTGEVSMTDYYGVDTLPQSGEISLSDYHGVSAYTPISNVVVTGGANDSDTCTQDGGYCSVTLGSSWSVTYDGGDPSTDSIVWAKNSGTLNPTISGQGTAGASVSWTSSNNYGQGSSRTISLKCTVSNATNSDSGHTANGPTATLSGNNDGEFCFEENEPIWLADGSYKLAKEVQVGDILKSYNTPTMIDQNDPEWESWQSNDISDGYQATSTVVLIIPRVSDHYYHVNHAVKITGEHPVLAKISGIWQWGKIEDLTTGDVLKGSDGSEIPVTSITYHEVPTNVVTIGVEDVDTYYGGDLGGGVSFVAHNY